MTDRLARAVARSAQVAAVRTGHGVLAEAGGLFLRHFGAGPACIIADENTWVAAGQAVKTALQAAGIAVRQHILPAKPRVKPSVELAKDLQAVLATDAATAVAVGSGVINDVVKYAAFQLDRPYFCVATAASMDGYTSAGAPLSDHGFKITIPCRPARVVLADFNVIGAAPSAMIGWGYGDLSGKIPAGGDWIIADALGIEPIDAVAWPMVQDDLRGWLAHPARLQAGEGAAIEGLFAGLTLVGLAMEAHGTSRPASGADHQIAHMWEMEDLHHGGERVSHGACVAVGCVIALRLFDWLLTQDLGRIQPMNIAMHAPDIRQKKASIKAAIPNPLIADRAFAETAAKHREGPALQARLARLVAIWPDLAARLRAHLMPADEMIAQLRLAGAPTAATDIGVSDAHLRQTIRAARFIRSRYTVLDLLDEAGLFEQALAAILPGALEVRERA
jgi:glycerol-1-phosphate dehydrogenase [NAD(P)+]